MRYIDVIQQIRESGLNPNDFNITILEGGYKIEPTTSYEVRKVAKEEDVNIALKVTDLELENIQLGQLVTELELQLLKLKGGVN